jgi:hypothetical protein
MKTTQYVRQLKAIEAAEASGIRERWLFGLRFLRDPEVMAPSGKSLRHGAAEKLIAAAGLNSKGKRRLSEQEIQRCIRCARAYPTESQIRRAATDFDSWWDLVDAGFPPYEAPEGEPPAGFQDLGHPGPSEPPVTPPSVAADSEGRAGHRPVPGAVPFTLPKPPKWKPFLRP